MKVNPSRLGMRLLRWIWTESVAVEHAALATDFGRAMSALMLESKSDAAEHEAPALDLD